MGRRGEFLWSFNESATFRKKHYRGFDDRELLEEDNAEEIIVTCNNCPKKNECEDVCILFGDKQDEN